MDTTTTADTVAESTGIPNLIDYWVSHLPEGSSFAPWAVVLGVLGCILFAYLLGSFNFSVMISKSVLHDDVRKHGSGNAGTTNMYRNYGTKYAVITLVGDFFKGIIASYLGMLIYGSPGLALASFFVILGHMFPVYFKFKGGKGVATMFAVALVTHPLVAILLFIVYLIVFLGTHYVSLASVMSALFYPLFLRIFLSIVNLNGSPTLVAAVMIALFVVFMHRENIKRLYNRKESKTYLKHRYSSTDISSKDDKAK